MALKDFDRNDNQAYHIFDHPLEDEWLILEGGGWT